MNGLRNLGFAVAIVLAAWGWFRSPSKPPARQREIILPNPPKAEDATQAASPDRTARLTRIRELHLDPQSLRPFIQCYGDTSREKLIEAGLLKTDAPAMGTKSLGSEHRTSEGNALLQHAKDTLYALLFGDPSTNTQFDRVQRELLTLTLPRTKANALGFMQAATELSAAGTWQDPESVSSDERAENIILEVEYGEIKEEWIGDGVLTALKLINNLEVNEQLLYARMTDIEQSTLVQ